MNNVISNIAGKINEAVGKDKHNAQDPSLHEEGAEQEALGKGQQDEEVAAQKPGEDR
jgi:uncharacterized protein YjbJ (UPF0337 family)